MEIGTYSGWSPIRDTQTLGLAIAQLRRDADFDQAELANRIGVHRPAVSRLENGHAVAQLELVFTVLRELGWQLRLERLNGQ